MPGLPSNKEISEMKFVEYCIKNICSKEKLNLDALRQMWFTLLQCSMFERMACDAKLPSSEPMQLNIFVSSA